MNFLKNLDPVCFHEDVLSVLDTLHHSRPLTTVGIEIFVKKPIQLTLACFSSVLAVAAAAREAFMALGNLIIAGATFSWNKTCSLLRANHAKTPLESWDRCKYHTFRLGCQLLGAPVSLIGALFMTANQSSWLLTQQIRLKNYHPHQAGEVPPLPPLREPQESVLPPPQPPRHDTAPVSPKAEVLSLSLETQLASSKKILKPSPKPTASPKSLKETKSRNNQTLRLSFASKLKGNKTEETALFCIEASREGKNGWYATRLSFQFLNKQIPGFSCPKPLVGGDFEEEIDDLLEYIKAAQNLDSLEVNHSYKMGNWEIFLERLEDSVHLPKAFISQSSSSPLSSTERTSTLSPEKACLFDAIRKNTGKRAAAHQTVRFGGTWNEDSEDSDEESSSSDEAPQVTLITSPRQERPSVLNTFAQADTRQSSASAPPPPSKASGRKLPPTPKEVREGMGVSQEVLGDAAKMLESLSD